MNEYQRFIALSRYARWLPEENRRETWDETVDRYIDNVVVPRGGNHVNTAELRDAIRNLEVLPSMRGLMTAGPALERDNVAGYNCAYLVADHPRAFDEAMYILMCGTGVGFSVERQYVSQLPVVNEHFEHTDTTINVADSKAGWARAFRELISLLYSGQIPNWDMSKIRPAGARLKTMGGRASGPEPLDNLFTFTCDMFVAASGRKLTSIECHDLLCKVGEVVVVGGVRRSALISLSNLSDERMRHAKTGNFPVHRHLANNSACYTERPDLGVFMQEWKSLYDSKSGERGIFNRPASKTQAGRNGRRNTDHEFGTNPCSEIILRPSQFCNLTEVVVRTSDKPDDLIRKVRLATILGTVQSLLTDFKYLRNVWKQNTEEERLLGVSLTGILDHPYLAFDDELLEQLRDVAVETNKQLASELGINPATAITCVKPSGTVSQLVDSSSGVHPRFSKFYTRNVRGDAKDPLSQLLIEEGVPYEPDHTNPDNVVIFSFPQKAPNGATTTADLTAIDHLDIWKRLQESWCEHKPSITVSVREHEWLDVQAWVWRNWDMVSGIAFLPYDGHIYKQAPYIPLTEDEYNEKVAAFPKNIDWGRLSELEKIDHTTGTQEFACTGGVCEIVSIGNA